MKFSHLVFPVLVFSLFSPVFSSANLPPVKAWYDNDLIRSAVPAGEALRQGKGWELFRNDTVKKVSGDYSIQFQATDDISSPFKVGFVPFPSHSWQLQPMSKVRFWVSVDVPAGDALQELMMGITTRLGESYTYPLDVSGSAGSEWMEVTVHLLDFSAFDSSEPIEISEVFVVLDAPAGTRLWFDDVRFEWDSGDSGVRITDKPIDLRQAEALESREMRVTGLFEMIYAGIDKESPTHEQLYAGLWLDKDSEWLNAEIQRHLSGEREDLGGHGAFAFSWSLFAAPWLTRTYLTFGPGDGALNNRLSKKTEDMILEKLWDLTKDKNDIHWARHRNPWWMDGSENHDLNGVVYNYLSSMIFSEHPDYKGRIYPNAGHGGGPGYWFHMHGDEYFYGPYGEAELSDGGEYRAADHYEAWGTVLREMMQERLRKGLFLEHASPSYMNYTLSYLMDLQAYSSSSALRELTEGFLNVVWAEWALETINGFRGGAKTRDHTVLDVREDSMYQIGKFLFGGVVDRSPEKYYWLGASDYHFPEVVWRFAFDRESKGDFSLTTRTIGEEPTTIPREAGLERTLNLATEHRMFRTSWITPHYVLGAQHDHPFAVHSHLSPASRSYGLNFSTHPDSRIFPYGVRQSASGDWDLVRRGGIMYRAVQGEHVLLSQQSRGYERREPEWFPRRSTAPIQMGVYFSDRLDTIVEKDGWIFVHEGNAFAAVRIVEAIYSAGDGIGETTSFLDYAANAEWVEELRTDNYRWNQDRTIAVADNALSGLIFDTSHIGRHASFEAFIDDVLSSELILHKTVVPGWFVLEYQGSGEDAPVLQLNLANNEAPKIDGKAVDYERELLFDSKFMKSDYDSGVIESRDDGFSEKISF